MAMASKHTGLTKSCVLIIVVASLERFAYKGVASNLVTYLTDVVKLSTSSAAKNVSSWCGLTSMLPLLGAFLADSYWDRYSTIIASSLLYVLGLVSLTSWALAWRIIPMSNTLFASALFTSLYLISIAQGGYNPCLQAFGADQMESDDGQDLLPCKANPDKPDSSCDNDIKRSSFFQWWYFGICTGSLLGVIVMSYIQDNYGWGWGFAIPAIAMAFSAAFFMCGTRLYSRKQLTPTDKPVEAIFQSIKKFIEDLVCGKIRLPSRDGDAVELAIQEKKPLRSDFKNGDGSCMKAVDKVEAPVTEAPALRLVWRLLPIWAMLLMFAVIFQQPVTFFTKQGMAMKRNIGNSFEIPPATLQSAITVSIILLMPLYDKLIIPALRLVTRDKKGISVMQRMGIGMCLSVVAMVIAALVERKRLELMSTQGGSNQLSIFYLLPQYIILGISDVFTVVGMQEFFYAQVPTSMRSIGFGLYLSVFGVGSFLSAILITVVEMITGPSGTSQSWFSDDMSQARLDNYYWLLAVLSAISFLVFIGLAKHFCGKTVLANESKGISIKK